MHKPRPEDSMGLTIVNRGLDFREVGIAFFGELREDEHAVDRNLKTSSV